MGFPRIPLDFATLTKSGSYYKYNHLPACIKDWLDEQNEGVEKRNQAKKDAAAAAGLPIPDKVPPLEPKNTSCAMQVSHAFNTTKQKIRAASFWRSATPIPGGNGIYILAVNEMDAYMSAVYGATPNIKGMEVTINGLQGLIVFGGAHVEFWDGSSILQNGGDGAVMVPSYIWSRPYIKFWEISTRSSDDDDDGSDTEDDVVPEWVQGWWHVYDGNNYYYYFSGRGIVTYIKTAPNPNWVPPMNVGNQGRVTMTAHGLKIVWNPADGGQTIEDFTRLGWTSETDMNGASNRYAPLYARKIKKK